MENKLKEYNSNNLSPEFQKQIEKLLNFCEERGINLKMEVDGMYVFSSYNGSLTIYQKDIEQSD